jgi:hypothetical protein
MSNSFERERRGQAAGAARKDFEVRINRMAAPVGFIRLFAAAASL